MKIYHYNNKGVFMQEGVADMSPLEPDVPLVPAFATLIAPPIAASGQVAIWNGEAWQLQTDPRGTEYWLPDRQHKVIEEVDEVIPPEATTTPPPDDDLRKQWDGRAWTVPAETIVAEALAALADIDLRSIRRLRELNIADQRLSDLEAEAVLEREKLPTDMRG